MLDLIHYSKKARDTLDKLKEFLKEHVYPAEMVREKINVNFYSLCVQILNLV